MEHSFGGEGGESGEFELGNMEDGILGVLEE